MKFGEFVRELRIKNRVKLREFCLQFGHDPSNWSKIERGKLLPPTEDKTLEEWANQLGLKKGSSDWYTFFDLAAAARGEIPSDIMQNEDVVSKLPLFYRTLRGQKPTVDEMKSIAKLMKDS